MTDYPAGEIVQSINLERDRDGWLVRLYGDHRDAVLDVKRAASREEALRALLGIALDLIGEERRLTPPLPRGQTRTEGIIVAHTAPRRMKPTPDDWALFERVAGLATAGGQPVQFVGAWADAARPDDESAAVVVFKHTITRKCLNLTTDGRCWRMVPQRSQRAPARYVPITTTEALRHFYEHVEEE